MSLGAMTESLAHRGPDDQGTLVRDRVGLGHRRLSIIDVDTGHQPLSNEDERVWVTYNGELYNYRELRAELAQCGHRFRTQSDTEVVVHAWEEWGAACVERFRGMFAFAIADWNRRELFLARDHLGIKPLYYSVDDRQLAFASELQALYAWPAFDSRIDLRALDEYLRFGYIPAPRSIFAAVKKLPPAHRLTLTFDGKTTGPQQYWRLRYRPQENVSAAQWSRRLEDVLRESVRSHLVADVPFGAFLSGGVDSTAIVGLMSQEMNEPVKTFSIGFDASDFDETQYARQVARHYRTEHYEEIIAPDALAILPKLVQHYGEPFGDDSAIPTYYLAKLARQFVPMVLSGDGGDEAFAGYSRYRGWQRWLHPSAPRRPIWKRLLRPLARGIFPQRFPVDGSRPKITAATWPNRTQMLDEQARRAIWRGEFADVVGESCAAFDDAFRQAADVPDESLAQFMDYNTYLPNDILAKVDVASMMHGLEVRTPMVDIRVAEFAATIPFDVSLSVAPDGGWEGKRVLKRMVAKDFGGEFVARRKTGFCTPLKHWLARGGDSRREIHEQLTGRDARLADYFDPRAVRQLLHDDDESDNSRLIWQLLFLENWLAYHDDSLRRAERAGQGAAV